MGIAKTSATALGRQPANAIHTKVLQEFSRRTFKDLSSDRHSYDPIFTFST
jgi:hypothetical protein